MAQARPEWKESHSAATKAAMDRPDVVARLRAAQARPEEKARKSAASKAMWARRRAQAGA